MARPQRYDYEGAFHHVFHRGARKAPIFRRESDFLLFWDLLGEVVEKFGWEVHAVVLMLNHYHLLIRSMRANLSDCLRYLNGRFAQQLNVRHDWDGPVFGGRFKNQNVEEESYLRYLVAYIHLNPLRANLVPRLESDWWSSQQCYLGLEPAPPWLTTTTIMEYFGDIETLREFTLGIHQGREAWPKAFELETGFLRGPAPGDELVVSERYKEGELFRRGLEPEQVLEAVCAITGAVQDELTVARWGRGANAPRRFATWALAESTLLRQREIGALLGMTSAQVSSTLTRERRGDGSERVREWRRQWAEFLAPDK